MSVSRRKLSGLAAEAVFGAGCATGGPGCVGGLGFDGGGAGGVGAGGEGTGTGAGGGGTGTGAGGGGGGAPLPLDENVCAQ